jgi:hypothetical protein
MHKLTITRIIPAFLLLLFSTVSAFSQYGDPKAILAYAADEFEVEIVDAGGIIITDIYSGMELSEGDTIRTNGTVAELSLDPNGSIIKLSPNTVFTIRQLQRSDETSNDFHMVAGKLRSIAARGNLSARYRVSTPSAVCGVRGTDFGVISIPGSEEKAFVIDGLIDYSNAAGQTISLSSGQIADALAASFEAFQASQEQLQQLIQDVVFEQLDPSLVPGHSPEIEEPEIETEEPEAEEAVSEEEVLAEDKAEDEPSDVDTVQDEPARTAESGDAGGDGEAGPLGKLGEMLGLEIGTVTIDGLTYSKAVLQPVFEIGKLKAALYLPIIYSNDLFDPEDWYAPRGNDEWSFGADQDWGNEPLTAAGDLASDLFLKLRYLEYGGNRDPFYLRLGNLRTMTIGHGILMKNYANDFDFPAIRRLGVNTGVKGNKLGFEAVVNDLSTPEVFGGRLVWRPMGMDFPLGFGVSGIIDINPDSMSDPDYILTMTDPLPGDIMLLGTALDMELPVLENSVLSIVFFGDAAAMLPVIDGTPEIEAVYDDSAASFSEAMRNYGLESGVFGNVLFVDYRLSYRYYQGSFRPTLFGPSYERLRGVYALDAYEYLLDPSAADNDKVVMGVFGEAGTDILKLFRIEAGYFWPWSPSGGDVEEDSLNLTLTVFPDVIPVLGIYGSITYSRTKFLPLLTDSSDEDLQILDAYAAFSGEIIYPLAPNLDIVLAAGSALKYEGSEPVFNSDGTPKMVPNFTLETRVHF